MSEQMHIPEFSNPKLVTAGVLAVLALGTVAACTANRNPEHHASTANEAARVVDLLDGSWNMDGVTQANHTLQVEGTDSKIVHQDGSGGQPNPAVNEYGTHLKTTGDFTLTAHVTKDANGSATLQLYNKPPVIADEFRVEPASVAVTEKGGTVSVNIWDGKAPKDDNVTSPKPIFSKSAGLNGDGGTVVISRVGNDWQVKAGDTAITDKNGAKPFTAGNAWIGMSSPDTGFTVDKLTAQGLDGGTVATIDTTKTPEVPLSPTGLQALASKVRPDFTIGTAVALGPMESDSEYAQQLGQNFGGITLENALKPQFISPKQGVYNFEEADAIIAQARKNNPNVKIHGHTIAFSEGLPQWMRNLPHGTDAERAASGKILLGYVHDYMTHYKGVFTTLDVVNEPLDTDQGTDQQQNIWSQVFGDNYGRVISQAVYKVDPNVLQFVNENGLEMSSSDDDGGDRLGALISFVQRINTPDENGEPGQIVGLGFQNHNYDSDTDSITSTGLNANINRAAAAKLLVRVSENDVTDDRGTQNQAKQYVTSLTTCIQNPNCISYTTWGFNDRYDLFIDNDDDSKAAAGIGTITQGNDLLFNGSKPTPAYTQMQAALVKLGSK